MSDELTKTATAPPRRTVGASTAERTVPCVYVVYEHARPTESPLRLSLEGADVLNLGRGTARTNEARVEGGAQVVELRIPDARMSTRHARLSRVLGRWILEDLSSKNGTFVGELSVDRTPLDDRTLIQIGNTWLLFDPRAPVPSGLRLEIAREAMIEDPFATLSMRLEHAFAAARAVAISDVPILVIGPTGTGKEVLARAVHRASRRSGSVIAVNCGALSSTLLEAELFGHKKGSFSGAGEDRNGLIRDAEQGTLLLDEIGDLPLAAQAALLRALQEREVTPVGGSRAIKVDFRALAATHRDLDAMIAAGQFRRDLHARLAGLTVRLPSLAERTEDLGLLIARTIGPHPITPEAASLLFAHDWPGNIRELAQALTTARILAGESPIDAAHLPEALRPPADETKDDDPTERARREDLVRALTTHRGNVSAVARTLGKARMQIQRWMRRYDLHSDQFR